MDKLVNAIPQSEGFEDFSFTVCGVTVRCAVEYSGWINSGEFLVADKDTEQQSYSLQYTVELAE